MTSTTVQISGLADFQRALRRMDKDLPKGLRVALNGCADTLIKRTVPLIPRRTGAAARSLKPRSTRTAVRVAVGGKSAPYYPWLDFGGRTGRNRSVVRRFYPEGRYLYPTLAKNRDEFTQTLQAALVGVAEGAGLAVD